MRSVDRFWFIFFGVVLIFTGVMRVASGGSVYWGGPIAGWTGWPTGLIGILIVIICLRDRKRNKGKPDVTDEQVERAKEEMDRMYVREHGEPPQPYIDKDTKP